MGAFVLLIVWASLVGCAKEDPYPIKTVQEASQSGNYMGWQLQKVLGDQNGPFRVLGDQLSNDPKPGGGMSARFVTFKVDGIKQRFDLMDLKGEVLLGRFENKAGNSMVLVFTQTD